LVSELTSDTVRLAVGCTLTTQITVAKVNHKRELFMMTKSTL